MRGYFTWLASMLVGLSYFSQVCDPVKNPCAVLMFMALSAVGYLGGVFGTPEGVFYDMPVDNDAEV